MEDRLAAGAKLAGDAFLGCGDVQVAARFVLVSPGLIPADDLDVPAGWCCRRRVGAGGTLEVDLSGSGRGLWELVVGGGPGRGEFSAFAHVTSTRAAELGALLQSAATDRAFHLICHRIRSPFVPWVERCRSALILNHSPFILHPSALPSLSRQRRRALPVGGHLFELLSDALCS